MDITSIVDRLGVPDSIDWGDPAILTYGDSNIRLPRDGTYVMAAAPTLDALAALLARTPEATQYPAEPAPEALNPEAPPEVAEVAEEVPPGEPV